MTAVSMSLHFVFYSLGGQTITFTVHTPATSDDTALESERAPLPAKGSFHLTPGKDGLHFKGAAADGEQADSVFVGHSLAYST